MVDTKDQTGEVFSFVSFVFSLESQPQPQLRLSRLTAPVERRQQQEVRAATIALVQDQKCIFCTIAFWDHKLSNGTGAANGPSGQGRASKTVSELWKTETQMSRKGWMEWGTRIEER